MASNYDSNNYPKSLSEASRKIAFNAFLAAILCVIVYISILFIFRTVGNPKIIGYTTTISIVDKDGNTTGTEHETHYFSENEKKVIPDNDETHYHNRIYTNDTFPEVLSQILMLIIYVLMIYTVAWNFGSHRKNDVAYGRNKRDKLEGAKAGLYSSILFFISYILLIFAKIGMPIKFALGLFGLVNACYLPLFNCFVNNEHGTYGLVAITSNSPSDYSWLGIIVMLIPLIIKIAVCFAGYELGYRQIYIKDKIMYKSNKINQ